MKNFISIKDMSKYEIMEVLDVSKELEENVDTKLIDGKIVASIFFEPSTRTRLSFTSAAYKIGGRVLGFDSPEMSSLKKGESLRDTIKMLEAYSDIIIMRHNIEGAAKFASEVTECPIINAGDGANEHPSQTLLDLYTIREEHGNIENIKIAFVGDIKYGRTVHSLAKAMSMFGAEFYFVAPEIIQIPDYILKDLDEKNIKYHICDSYEDILKELDCLYMTRIQKERFLSLDDYEKVKNVYNISREKILNKCKDNMMILHPLPRVDEISIDLDNTGHAKYFKQARNGVPVREAMIALATGVKKSKAKIDFIDYNITEKPTKVCRNPKCVVHFEETKNRVVQKSYGEFCYYCSKEIK